MAKQVLFKQVTIGSTVVDHSLDDPGVNGLNQDSATTAPREGGSKKWKNIYLRRTTVVAQ